MTSDFVNPLLAWYNTEKRALPWRMTKDPYCIWISEIMLQQTRVETVIPYYERFLGELPSIGALADCDEERLLKLWEGLGYYSRARNLKKAAVLLREKFGSCFPDSEEKIKSLPGIGSYTAGAIGSIAFELPLPAVDGNVLRVCARLDGLLENVLDIRVRRRTEERLRQLLKERRSEEKKFSCGDFNQALIELGALVCVPNGEPKCESCPVRAFCTAAEKGLTAEIPVRIKKNARRTEERTVLIVRDGEKTAVRRRPETGLLAGLYEFPNVSGFISEREALAAVKEAGLEPLRIRPLPAAKHIFTHIEWHMRGYEILTASGEEICEGGWLFAEKTELEDRMPVATAFAAYAEQIGLGLGKKRKTK